MDNCTNSGSCRRAKLLGWKAVYPNVGAFHWYSLGTEIGCYGFTTVEERVRTIERASEVDSFSRLLLKVRS